MGQEISICLDTDIMAHALIVYWSTPRGCRWDTIICALLGDVCGFGSKKGARRGFRSCQVETEGGPPVLDDGLDVIDPDAFVNLATCTQGLSFAILIISPPSYPSTEPPFQRTRLC